MYGRIDMKVVKYLSIVLMTIVIVAGIAMPMVQQPKNGLEFPLIPGLENNARNIFFHVPVAWASVLGFLIAMYYGFRYLRTKDLDYDVKSVSSAGLGMMFCLLATITGSIWAKFNWGSFWNWDPRETSIFILLLIYGAYFSLRSAIVSEEVRARISAVYAILAGITAPFFIFIMPRIAGGLHPGAKGDAAGTVPVAQLHMPANMRIVLYLGIIGFSLFFVWLFNLRVRAARLTHQLTTRKN
jgi:heme exporter protein C